MTYIVELDVDEFGSVDGPEDLFPINAADHDWRGVPYPPVASVVPFEWEPGETADAPDVIWYPQMWDWVCTRHAFDVLTGAAPGDLHLIAEGRLDESPVFVVQVLNILDVVDRERSVIDKYPSYEVLQFPSLFRSASTLVANRIFRVPGSVSMILMGETVKRAFDEAGLKGLQFTPVDWSDQPAPAA
jgi:hypothetical protein